MKNIFVFWLILIPFFGFGQVARPEISGVDSAAVEREVDSLIQLNRKLIGKQKYDEALIAIELAEKRAESFWDKENAKYANCLFNHGRTFYFIGKYVEAESYYLDAKTIREKVLGKEHPDYASSLNNLAVLYKDMGNYEKAEPLYMEAKAIREKVLGKEHPDYASSLNNLAVLYKDMGNYEKAEPLYMEAKAIREEVLGKKHPEYAWSLNNLAVLYYDMGNYEKAEPLYMEAKAIREKVLGKEHRDYATSLNSLAGLCYVMGNYEKAEPLYMEAKAILEKVLGKEHPDYAMSLNNLATLYYVMGNYEKAEPLYLEAKAIREKVLRIEHSDYALNLNGLATLYYVMGNYEKAEPLYMEAKAIWEKVLGKEHPYYASSLNNLANLYYVMGNYEKAEPLYMEAKAIWEKALGKKHPYYASSLHNLASLYSDMDNYEKAAPLFLEAKAIREKVLGKEHPEYAMNLNNLFLNYQKMSRYENAIMYCEELTSLNQLLLTKSLSYLSERELNKYIHTFSKGQDQLFSFTGIAFAKVTRLTPVAYTNALFHKGFLLNTANQINRFALSDSASTEKYNLLKSYRRRLATQYALPIAERDSVLIADLEEKANTLEKDLVRTVAGYGEAIRQVQWQEVQSALQPNEAAIEFVHYRYYDQKTRPTDSTMYAALILLPGDTAPHFIPLCEQRQLDVLIAHTPDREPKLYLQDVYWPRLDGQPSLYQLLWAPLNSLFNSPSVGGGRGEAMKTIYYSPSGLLHRINLSAVSLNQRTSLSDKYRLVALGSTRALVVGNDSKNERKNATAVVYGGIRYDMDSTAIARNNAELSIDSTASEGSGLFKYAERNQRTRGGEIWDYLPGTETEANNVRDILKRAGISTTLRKGYAATEESFKQLGKNAPSPRILHIATHGFFFPDPKSEVRSERVRSEMSEPAFKISEHPMIRSGLMLAGSQYAWDKGHPLTGMEDGILTAYEVSHTNLSATELVVLSACETGLGDIQGNEGVYGLQRAFKIAGAKYVLMSLWQVPDEKTQELMTAFYRKWLEEKMPLREAFEAAQQEMHKKYRSPFYWAGFVLIG